MNEKLKKDEAERQQVVLCKKRKRLLMLEELMQDNGLFTNAEEVQDFMEKDISESKKQARLKKEVKFAHESSTKSIQSLEDLGVSSKYFLLSSFCILKFLLETIILQVTLLNKRRRDKTAAEFADALMSYLGRKSDRSILRYELFQQSLRDLAQYK